MLYGAATAIEFRKYSDVQLFPFFFLDIFSQSGELPASGQSGERDQV